MWLIDTFTLKLVFHPSQPLNEYMILSHTWEDDEVTFQDFQNLEFARTKKGFSKIEYTCHLARKATLEWAWVDTCCIDKTSSAELSEAINSMYRWYKHAAICCAYLSDLPPAENSNGQREGKQDIKDWTQAQLPNCRWFTRGWTLQELLAPDNIAFYDNEWNLRGTKESLKDPISEITGIDVLALVGSRFLEDYPVAVRMAWCSKRETSRPEDLAYCLLGIFGVYMPMLYGEGTNAFLRLQDEICKNTDDLSIFAWKWDRPLHIPFQYRGLFAQSPVEFSACQDLIRFSPSRRRDSGFKVTNNGLVFEKALICYHKHGGSLLMLDCYRMNSSAMQNPKPLGIHLLEIDGQCVRQDPSEICEDVEHYFWLRVHAVSAKKVLSHREAIPLARRRLNSDAKARLLLPKEITIIKSFPPASGYFYGVESGISTWVIDDPAYLMYCHLRVKRPCAGDSKVMHSLFQALVAWGLDSQSGTEKAFLWTEQSVLWPKIVEIVGKDDSGSVSFWPSNYDLRELLLQEHLFEAQTQDILEATYIDGEDKILVKVEKSTDGRQLKILTQEPYHAMRRLGPDEHMEESDTIDIVT